MSKFDFLNSMEKNTNLTYTENGALTNKSSLNACLDLFSLAGSMRNRSEEDITRLLDLALAEDPLTALKYVFYNGDIRCGLGERRTFRIMLNHLAKNYPEYLKSNVHLIPHFNRWDSLYALDETKLERAAYDLIKAQLKEDIASDNPSLCAKWLPSKNASSKETKRLAKKTSLSLNLCNFTGDIDKKTLYKNEEKYRKTLSELRSKINIVEKKMSNSEFSNIDYSKIPSNAMNRYTKAFYNRDGERFEEFINDALLSKAKLNSKTLYPYEIVHKILNGKTKKDIEKTIAELQWTGLPDYVEGKDLKGLCVVDTSGSMWGTPMEVAISLGLYCAERCTGAFKDKFITFSSNPQIQTVRGRNVVEKVKNMESADWGMSTNIEKVFDLILNTAVDNNSPQEDIPEYLFIISDMEFDSAMSINRSLGYRYRRYDSSNSEFNAYKNTLFNTIANRFEACGYKMPTLVFWNVDARNNQCPMTADENGWVAVSGFSPTIFKAVLNGIILEEEETEDEIITKRASVNPIEVMMNTLYCERYEEVKF